MNASEYLERSQQWPKLTVASSLIFEYPTSPSGPPFTTVLSTVKGTHAHDSPVVDVSSTHAVYKSSSGRIACYAFVRKGEDSELKLKTLQDDESIEDEPAVTGCSVIPTNPNLILVFQDRVLEVLRDYFSLQPLTIQANYDVLCNLMLELMQGGGPYITDLNTLRQLVPFKSSWSKLLSSTNQLAKSYASPQSQQVERSVPWRRPNVKYTNNELFVDITERITVVLSPKHPRKKASTGLFTKLAFLEGDVSFTSHLSGVPDISLNLTLNGHHLGNPAFHQCVRVDKWISNEGLVSFIPPDGETSLMKYTVELDQYAASKQHKSFGVVIPEYRQGLGTKKSEFEVGIKVLIQRGVSKVDGLKVKIHGNGPVKILRLSHGDFQANSSGGEWVFDGETGMGLNAVLRGVIEDNTDDGLITHRSPKGISLQYSAKGSLASGIRVGSVKVSGLDVKPYKGVKYVTTVGDFVIR